MKYREQNGIFLPEISPREMPRFSVRTFICSHEQDAEKFSKLVAKMGGKFEKYVQIDFLNFRNEVVGFGRYVCIYQFHTDIEMEVLT
jgi:hypothetical protein